MKVWPAKDPDERLDYVYLFTDDLEPGETLASHLFITTNAAGVNVDAVALQADRFIAWLSGGIDGQQAAYTLRVTTNQSRILEDTVVLPIVAKVVTAAYPGGYVVPTVGNFLATYPEFSSVPPGQIAYYLNRAAQSVDLSWSAGDFGHARMLLAAHLLTLAGLGTSAEAAAIRSGADQFKSMGIASLSLVRFDKNKSSSFLATRYGTEFSSLLRRNRGGPRTTGSVARGWGDGDNYGPWTA